jgi:hypothetical protein
MNAVKLSHIALFILSGLLFAASPLTGQGNMPEVLDTGTVREQYEYLQERTRIYNNFRAIREDMFQKIKSNSTDSLAAAKQEIHLLESQLSERDSRISAQQTELQETNAKLEEAIKNRDLLPFLGIPMHKALYNTILWIIIAALVFLCVVLFLTAKRNIVISRKNQKDLEETREEFEAYRKTSRERYEQMVVKHHNELRKLKGK